MTAPTLLRRPPVPDVIALLERALESAKSGDVQAVVLFTTNTDRVVNTETEGSFPPGDVMLAVELWRSQEIHRYLQSMGVVE